jgi:hypothetical protein
MGVMYFDAQPIPEVEAFIKKHYKGGTVLDYGCGCGRYAHCFPDDMYLGVDGWETNIISAQHNHPNKRFALIDLETSKFSGYDYLFSSVVFDQIARLPLDWDIKHLILIEPSKYETIFNPEISESLLGTDTRMMYK